MTYPFFQRTHHVGWSQKKAKIWWKNTKSTLVNHPFLLVNHILFAGTETQHVGLSDHRYTLGIPQIRWLTIVFPIAITWGLYPFQTDHDSCSSMVFPRHILSTPIWMQGWYWTGPFLHLPVLQPCAKCHPDGTEPHSRGLEPGKRWGVSEVVRTMVHDFRSGEVLFLFLETWCSRDGRYGEGLIFCWWKRVSVNQVWKSRPFTWLWKMGYGYGSIPINTIFRGMNIYLPAILMFTRVQGFDTLPYSQQRAVYW